MSDWLSNVIGDDLITVYEGLYFTEDALIWLREEASHLWRVARRRSIGCGGWLPPSATRTYWSYLRIPIPMSACGWRVTE